MNLIEQQTAAKDLPLQYLQQAVNGQNPNLTPWIATAELQRRTTMDQHMQKGQAGPMPTVKDQVEQKAGLMATQAAQLAQANQPGTPPPGPVPEGVPQPQPQPEEPVMAARGGLMNAPVSFQFARGGILGYADGGETANTNTPETYVDDQGIRRFTSNGQPVQQAQTSQQPRPQGLRAGVEQYANEPTQAQTLPSVIAEHRALQKEFGTDQPIGSEERKYWDKQDALQKQREAQAKDLAYASYVQGTVGTPGSGALAYNRTLADALGQSADFQGQRYKDLASLNTAQRAAAEKQQTEAGTAFGAAKTAAAAERLGKAGIGERLLNVDTQAATAKMQDLTSRYNNEQTNKTHLKVAELNRAMQGAQFNRQEARDAANQLNQLGQRAEADVNNLRTQFANAQKNVDDAEMARVRPLLTNAEAVHKEIMKASAASAGINLPTGPANSLSAADQQALNWANSNPKDPRAAQIKQRLGM
jgi:hypothetical protein